jgi:hypothetical protein
MCDLSVGQPRGQTSFLRGLRLRHLFGSPDWSTGKPDFDNPKVRSAAAVRRFDLDAVPVTIIDGKNLW